VYNWGQNIADGSDDTLDIIAAFEEAYPHIKVNYSTYDSNETLYTKLANGGITVDVIIPSDYMIAKMAEENLLHPLNFENIPNYQYIDDAFKGLYYDPQNQYSVPYTYGIVGVIYDANVVDEADIGGWELMWNEKYSGRIVQFNNPRDAFGTAQYKLGLDVNSSDKAMWDLAYGEMLAQRPLVYSYVMDEIFNMMESGEAAIGAYYAGDYFTMVDAQAENVDLQFYYPEQTNFYVDAMCIPSCAQNKERIRGSFQCLEHIFQHLNRRNFRQQRQCASHADGRYFAVGDIFPQFHFRSCPQQQFFQVTHPDGSFFSNVQHLTAPTRSATLEIFFRSIYSLM
jgi:spermidine/putrescine transport system substrate-binding protein